MSPALELRGVRKRYGKTVALDGLDLRVERGTMLGLVGPNGAGKTTTFSIVSGAIRPDAGEVHVLGEGPFDPRRQAGALGILPQDCALNPHSSARQLLTFFARLQGLSRKDAAKDAERLLEALRLRERASSRVGQLSHGMKRRLAVAQAFVGDPALVLLDEPTGGLDPHLVVDMRALLLSEKRKRTLIVSSHILSDLEQTCDRVAFLEEGRCIREDAVDAMRVQSGRVRLRFARALDDAERSALRRVLGERLEELAEREAVYALRAEEPLDEVAPALLAELTAAGVPVLEVGVGASLEEAYLATRAEALEG